MFAGLNPVTMSIHRQWDSLIVSKLTPNIWQLQAQGDSKALIAALQNADSDVRKRAAAALHVLGDIEAIPALNQAIKAETDESTRTDLKIILDDLIREHRNQAPHFSEATRSLVAQLQSNNPATIIKAANKLGTLKDKTAVESLMRIFQNNRLPGSVRLSAAEALIEMDSAPMEVSLLAALRSESWQIRRNGAAILGQWRADWAVERIAEGLHDQSEHVRRTAHAALKRIDNAEARNALQAYERLGPLTTETSRMDDTHHKKKDPTSDGTPASEPHPTTPSD